MNLTDDQKARAVLIAMLAPNEHVYFDDEKTGMRESWVNGELTCVLLRSTSGSWCKPAALRVYRNGNWIPL